MLTLFVAALAIGQGAEPQEFFGHYFSIEIEKPVPFRLPASSLMKSASYQSGQITATMQAPLTEPEGRYSLETYFDNNVCVVAVRGKMQLFVPTIVGPNEVAVIGLSPTRVLGKGKLEVDGANIKISYDKSLTGIGEPHYIVSRYLPREIDPADVSGGMGACVADVKPLTKWGDQRLLIHNGLYDIPDKRTGIFLPPGPENAFPSLGPRAKRVQKQQDLDGDGRNDWQFKPIWAMPRSRVVLNVCGLDRGIIGAGKEDGYALIWGYDDNGDNTLGPGEIGGSLAQYGWNEGNNLVWLERHKNKEWYVHWLCVNPDTHAFRHGFAEVIRFWDRPKPKDPGISLGEIPAQMIIGNGTGQISIGFGRPGGG